MPEVIARRLASLAKQPLHAFVEIRIGDKLLATNPAKPNILQDFEMTQIQGTGDKAQFTIFDDNWEEIERIFSQHWNNVTIRFGYVDSSLVSDTYKMMLQNYSLSFNNTGVILSVSAIATETVRNLSFESFDVTATSYTDAIKQICRRIGVIVRDEDFEETGEFEGGPRVFSLQNELPITYMLEEIIPYTSIDSENLVLHIENNRAYLKKSTFVVPSTEERVIKTYIYQKGYDSVVQDLTFDVKGVFGGASMHRTASGIQSVFFDPYTKEEHKVSETISTVSQVATGEYQSMRSSQSIPYVDAAGYDYNSMKSRVFYQVQKSATSHYEAKMTIIGDPTMKVMDKVRIINMTDEGYLHHTSGIYQVKGVLTNIDGSGVMYTSLDLIRNTDIELGLELINPKTLVK